METSDEAARIPRLWCSARLNLAILTMLGCVCFYSLRVNVSFSVVCMVNHTAIALADVGEGTDSNNGAVILTSRSNNSIYSPNGSYSYMHNSSHSSSSSGGGGGSQCGSKSASAVYQDGGLAWNKEEQGLVLGSIFWGYMLTNIAGGIVATRYGGKRVIGGALACAAVLTAVTPVAARSGVYAIMAVRIFVGVCLGCISPALHALWAQWAPPMESSKLRSFCFAGCQMGYVMTFPVTALLCEYGFDGGWPSVFYVMAGLVLVWCLAWMFLVTDSPVDHPRISAEEQMYIVTSLKGTVSMDKKRRHSTPWRKVLQSRPVWAAFVSHVCFNWGEYTFLTNIPTYLREVLLFDIKANGLLSALPYVCFWLVINVSGQLADVIRRRQLMNTLNTRKLFNFLGFWHPSFRTRNLHERFISIWAGIKTGSVIPAVLLVGVAFLDCSHAATAVALLTMGVAMTGCLYGAGLYINFADLSPRHAGVLYGISNTMATIPGFVAPIVIGVITHNQTQEEWRWVFLLAAVIYVVGCVFFFIFGSGDVQPWAVELDECEIEAGDEKCLPLTNGTASEDAKGMKKLIVKEEVLTDS